MSMWHIKVAVDLDGVLVDYPAAKIRWMMEKYPDKVPEGYVPNDWDWSNSGLTQKQLREVDHDMQRTVDFWANLAPYPVAVESLRNFLVKHPECAIIYVTSRLHYGGDNHVIAQTNIWLDRYQLRTPSTTLVVVENAQNKPAVYSAIGAAYSVDDRPETVELAYASRGRHKPFLFLQPWNHKYALESNLPSVVSMDDFLRRIVE